MSLVTGGLGDDNSGNIVVFETIVIKDTIKPKLKTYKFDNKTNAIKFTIKEIKD